MKVLRPYHDAYRIGRQGYFAPEHRPLVERLRRTGLTLDDLDEFDQHGDAVQRDEHGIVVDPYADD